MITSLKGMELIKAHEGLSLRAYKCKAGVWTIGYGHTAGVQEGDEITECEADGYLMRDMRWAEDCVAAIGVPLRQNQFDALVSLVFNIGIGNFESSTIRKRVKANPDDERIRAEFMRWVKVRENGKLVENTGLKKRRANEANLYFS